MKPDSFQKQNVKLAFQVLSARTAACIYTALALNCFNATDKPIAESTANFFSKINELTDILNSASKYSTNPNKCAISEEKAYLVEKLKMFRTEIATWQRPEKTNEFARKQMEPYCFKGLLQTINGVILIWEDLRPHQEYFITGHLNQDPLENQFSIIRSNKGSYERNPSALRFAKSLSQSMFQHATPPKTSSYSVSDAENLIGIDDKAFSELTNSLTPEDDEEILTQVENKVCNETTGIFSASQQIFFQHEDQESDVKSKSIELVELSVDQKMKNSAISYLSGFICNRIKKLKCMECLHYAKNQDENLEQDRRLLIQYRAYDCSNDDNVFGHLCVPSIHFENDFTKILKIFEDQFHSHCHEPNIITTMVNIIEVNMINITLPNCHKSEIIKYSVTLLTRFALRRMNFKLKAASLNKAKLQNFKGL